MSHYSFDAVIFDLDGVITMTAAVHAESWKAIFDEYKNQFKDRLQEEAKNLARKKLDTMMKKMFNFLDEL